MIMIERTGARSGWQNHTCEAESNQYTIYIISGIYYNLQMGKYEFSYICNQRWNDGAGVVPSIGAAAHMLLLSL